MRLIVERKVVSAREEQLQATAYFSRDSYTQQQLVYGNARQRVQNVVFTTQIVCIALPLLRGMEDRMVASCCSLHIRPDGVFGRLQAHPWHTS